MKSKCFLYAIATSICLIFGSVVYSGTDEQVIEQNFSKEVQCSNQMEMNTKVAVIFEKFVNKNYDLLGKKDKALKEFLKNELRLGSKKEESIEEQRLQFAKSGCYNKLDKSQKCQYLQKRVTERLGIISNVLKDGELFEFKIKVEFADQSSKQSYADEEHLMNNFAQVPICSLSSISELGKDVDIEKSGYIPTADDIAAATQCAAYTCCILLPTIFQ